MILVTPLRALCLLCSLAFVGCAPATSAGSDAGSDSSSDAGNDGSGTDHGTLTITGGFSGTINVPYSKDGATFDGTNGNVSIESDSSDTTPHVIIALRTVGEPAVGTYTETNSNDPSNIYAEPTGKNDEVKVWQAANGAGAQGTWTVNVTSLGGLTTAGSAKFWSEIHGTVTASLPPAPSSSSASGTVTITGTF